MDLVSDCCSANVYAPTNEWAICMDCKEHCDVIDLAWICVECGEERKDDARVSVGMKCGYCAYGG